MHLRLAAKYGWGPGLLIGRPITAALACLAVSLASACRKPAGNYPAIAIQHQIAPLPARVGPATLTLRLNDARGNLLTGARIVIEADMSHPGMTPGFAQAIEACPGHYQARLVFTMAGDWIIILHVTLPGGRKLERQIQVPNVRAV